jgi:hypothetical protein
VALCIAMMVARLIDPTSKLATARLLDGETTNYLRGFAVGLGITPRRPTAWLAISDSNFDVQSENSSL